MLRPLAVLSAFTFAALPACIAADDTADDTADDAIDDTELATDESEVITIGNACFNQWTTPQIVTRNIFYPTALNADGSKPVGFAPNAGRFERGGVVYLTGYQLNVRLLTDDCTYIKSVSLGSTVLPKDTFSGEYYQTFASTTPGGFGQEAHDVFVHVTPRIEGRTDTLTITVGRDLGLGTATYSIPLVRVERIEAKGVPAGFSITESEIQNIFARALYDAFDVGGANEIVVDGHRIHDYEPGTLEVDIPGNENVYFHFEFHAEMACSPRIKVDGRLRVTANDNGISVTVPNTPTVTPMWPNDGCVILAWALSPLVDDMTDLIGGEVRATITDVANQALATDGAINQFLVGTTMSVETLTINLSLQVPSVQLRPTYDPAFAASNLRFPAGEKIALLASGRGVREYSTTPNNHWTVAGPNGVPKSGTPDAFWPGTHSLSRPSGTVWNDQPVGRLLARTSPDAFALVKHAYTPGCAITVPAAQPQIRFGANDTVGGAFQTNARTVRALFLSMNGILAGLSTPCEDDQDDIIVVGP